jgi:hypothetical protein
VEHQYIQLQEVVGILFDQQVPIMKKPLVHEFLMTIVRNYEPKFTKLICMMMFLILELKGANQYCIVGIKHTSENKQPSDKKCKKNNTMEYN